MLTLDLFKFLISFIEEGKYFHVVYKHAFANFIYAYKNEKYYLQFKVVEVSNGKIFMSFVKDHYSYLYLTNISIHAIEYNLFSGTQFSDGKIFV